MSINQKDFRGARIKGNTFNSAIPLMRFATLFCLLFLFSVSLFAQPKDNSPYSRFGLGEPINHSLSSAGFGGLSAAYIDPLHVNFLNPASLGNLVATTFEVGMYAERSILKVDDQEAKTWTGNLSHVSLAFPMRNPLSDLLAKKKRKFFWGMNIGLIPNTSVGYDIQTESILTEGDTTRNSFQGTGGTNRLVWGNGVRYKDFSFGLNISYMFGQLETLREVRFDNRVAAYNNSFQDDISVRGVQFTFGATYQMRLDKEVLNDGSIRSKKSIIFGLYANPASNFSTESTELRIASNLILPGGDIVDTLLNNTGVERDGKLPSEITLGVTYQVANKLRVGAEYQYSAWSNYENEAREEELYNSNRFAFGAEYSPNSTSYNNYFQRIRYRAGFYYREDPRLEDFTQYALTVGLGLPVVLPRQKTSFVNLAVEWGRYDTSGAIDENFVKMSLGFTLNDSGWFYKRKFR